MRHSVPEPVDKQQDADLSPLDSKELTSLTTNMKIFKFKNYKISEASPALKMKAIIPATDGN